jgi:hypothetical protein
MFKFACVLLIFSSILQAEMTKIECYRNEAVKEVRPILDDWAIRYYREYPYLYVYQEETDYNSIFEVDPTAFVLFAESKGQKIGHLSANALNSPFLENDLYTPVTVLDQIQKKGFDLEKVLYISCFLTIQDERLNQEMASQLFNRAVEMAKELGKTQICYMGIVEDAEHPLKPVPYVPIEPWGLLETDFRSLDVKIELSWPTLQPDGQVKEEAHTLELFIKDI